VNTIPIAQALFGLESRSLVIKIPLLATLDYSVLSLHGSCRPYSVSEQGIVSLVTITHARDPCLTSALQSSSHSNVSKTPRKFPWLNYCSVSHLPCCLHLHSLNSVIRDGTLITQRLYFAPSPCAHRHVIGWYRLIREAQGAGVNTICIFDGKQRHEAKAQEVSIMPHYPGSPALNDYRRFGASSNSTGSNYVPRSRPRVSLV
jgi:hypothetical protein